MEFDEALRAAAGEQVARLATIGAHGAPHVVPIVFAIDGLAIVTAIDGKPKRTRTPQRITNIERDPRVAVLFDRYDDDWRRLWWVRADGRARVVDDIDEVERVAGLLGKKYPQYAEVSIDGPAIVIAVERWSAWRADE